MQSNEGDDGSIQFTTKDSPECGPLVLRRGLKKGGFKITANVSGDTASASGGMLSAEDGKRTVVVTVGTEGSGSTVNVLFGTKK